MFQTPFAVCSCQIAFRIGHAPPLNYRNTDVLSFRHAARLNGPCFWRKSVQTADLNIVLTCWAPFLSFAGYSPTDVQRGAQQLLNAARLMADVVLERLVSQPTV